MRISDWSSDVCSSDLETVALTAGGHTFGKAHGAGDASLVGGAPETGDITLMGLGWSSSFETGVGAHAITSGLEGAWVNTPTQWSENFFRLLQIGRASCRERVCPSV